MNWKFKETNELFFSLKFAHWKRTFGKENMYGSTNLFEYTTVSKRKNKEVEKEGAKLLSQIVLLTRLYFRLILQMGNELSLPL